jgi:hypothetical protein
MINSSNSVKSTKDGCEFEMGPCYALFIHRPRLFPYQFIVGQLPRPIFGHLEHP